MNRGAGETQIEAERELVRGLAHALAEHYLNAAAQLARVRELLPDEQRPLLASLDAFVEGHVRYRGAQHALHEASRRFADVLVEQQARLADLQMFLSAPAVERLTTDRQGTTIRPSRAPAPPADRAVHGAALPELRITCFGRFAVWRAGAPVELCQNRNGQTILRYLVAQPWHRATMDALMEALWPDDRLDTARHKLHCASSALRRALNGEYAGRKEGGYLLCDGGSYALNPDAPIWIDSDEFLARYHAGEHTPGAATITNFEAACQLYAGPFLPDDLYADWSLIRREQLVQQLLAMCATIADHYLQSASPERAVDWAMRILGENRCDEGAYRLLMRAHTLGGNRGEALRQYERCKAVLAEQIGVAPMAETTELFRAILDHEITSSAPPAP